MVRGIHSAPRELLRTGNSLPEELVNQKLQILLCFGFTPFSQPFAESRSATLTEIDSSAPHWKHTVDMYLQLPHIDSTL